MSGVRPDFAIGIQTADSFPGLKTSKNTPKGPRKVSGHCAPSHRATDYQQRRLNLEEQSDQVARIWRNKLHPSLDL